MSEPKFIDGLRVWPPHERAPEFVKGAITIYRGDLINWLQNQRDNVIRLDVKESKKGGWYAQVNDYKPKQSGEDPGDSMPRHVSQSVPDLDEPPF